MGKKLCIDEVNLCGQVYTILSNVEKRNGIVSILPWTKSQPIIERLNSEISKDLLEGVKEVASDMWPSMELILKTLFTNADQVTDRFHYMKELLDDTQTVRKRIKTKLKIIENEERLISKEKKEKFHPKRYWMFQETLMEMITLVRYQCNKRKKDWNWMQKARFCIMETIPEFEDIVTTIKIIQKVFKVLDSPKIEDWDTNITIENPEKRQAEIKRKWREKLENRIIYAKKYTKKVPEINSMIKTTQVHIDGLVNYFLSGHSTAYAEWLHSRIRELIQNVRWFRNKDYMIYRILKMFADTNGNST